MTTIKPRLVTVDYVVALTGFSQQTVYKMARQGRIPSVRLGRAIRFDAVELDKWLTKLSKTA